jgi:hypothetical protein
VATVPPIGGFAPFEIARAAEGLIKGVVNAAGQVLDFLGQLWGALNNRTTTPETPATYSRGAYTGSYNPNSDNYFRLRGSGIVYIPRSNPRVNGVDEQIFINYPLSPDWRLGPGDKLLVQQWPDPVEEQWGALTYQQYHPSQSVDYQFRRGTNAPEYYGRTDIGFWKSDSEFTWHVTPIDPTGAIPYLPDVPAVPAVSDPVALVPVIAVTAKAAQVLPAITATPKKKSPVVTPPLPQPVPGVAPLVEEVPQIGGAGRQVTTVIGTLRKLIPAEVPRIVPLPARPIPGLQREMTPAGQTLPAPAPAPATTPTDLRKYGTQTITSIGVRPDLASIAAEVGRIEQKTGRLMQEMDKTPDWFDGLLGPLLNELKNQLLDALVVDVPAKTYTFVAPCDYDENGQNVKFKKEIAAADFEPAIVSRLDMIAEAIAVLKWWKQPLCRSSPPRANVTVTAEEFDPEA